MRPDSKRRKWHRSWWILLEISWLGLCSSKENVLCIDKLILIEYRVCLILARKIRNLIYSDEEKSNSLVENFNISSISSNFFAHYDLFSWSSRVMHHEKNITEPKSFTNLQSNLPCLFTESIMIGRKIIWIYWLKKTWVSMCYFLKILFDTWSLFIHRNLIVTFYSFPMFENHALRKEMMIILQPFTWNTD